MVLPVAQNRASEKRTSRRVGQIDPGSCRCEGPGQNPTDRSKRCYLCDALKSDNAIDAPLVFVAKALICARTR